MNRILLFIFLLSFISSYSQEKEIFDAVYLYDTTTVKNYLKQNGDVNIYQNQNVETKIDKESKISLSISIYEAALLCIRLGNESKSINKIICAYRNYNLLIEKFHKVIDKKTLLDKMLGLGVATGDISIVRWILENGADLNKRCELCYGRTPTLIAVAYNSNLEMIKFLMSQKPDLTVRDYDGRGYLHYSARNGNIVLLEYLLELQFEPLDVLDNNGISPIFQTLLGNHLPAYNFLLSKGARTDLITNEKLNILDYAAMSGNLDLFRQVYFTSGVQVITKKLHKLTDNEWIAQFGSAENIKKN